MIPDTERLIELTTQPLADNPESQLAAAKVLRQHLEAHPGMTPGDAAVAGDPFARADERPRRGRWRKVLHLTTLLVSLPVIVHSAWQFASYAGAYRMMDPRAVSTRHLPDHFSGLQPQEKRLLLGEVNATSEAERWKPLWDSDPGNPAYLCEYAAAYFSDHNKLSPEILAAAARIDPDNGWLPALAASAIADEAVTKESLPYAERKAGKSPVLKINDETRLGDALTAIHQVAFKPRLTTYQTALLKQRIPHLPPRRDFVSQTPAMLYVASQRAAIIHLIKLAYAFSAGAQQCAARKDPAGFRQITDDWKQLVQTTTHEGETIVELLVAHALFTNPLPYFRDAAQALGLDQEANRYASLHDRVKAEKEALKNNPRGDVLTDFLTSHGSIFSGMAMPMIVSKVANPPAISENDLRPGRYADHALFGRVASLLGWALLGLCFWGAGFRLSRGNPQVRWLSNRMLDLLRPSDWTWILLGGVLLPLLGYLAVDRFTPLAAREWSLMHVGLFQASLQFASMVVWMITMPPVIASWRLGKRGAVVGLETRRQWIGWLAAGFAALAIPIGGLVRMWRPWMFFNLAAFLLGLAVLWLLVGMIRNLIGRPVHAIRRATLTRMVMPAWVFGMLVFALTGLLHYAEERCCIQQDRLMEITPEAPALSRYEYEVSQALRSAMLEKLRVNGMDE